MNLDVNGKDVEQFVDEPSKELSLNPSPTSTEVFRRRSECR